MDTTGAGRSWAVDTPGPTRADRVALAAAVVLPVLGAVCKVFVNPGWAVLAFLMWSPAIVAIWCAGLVVLIRALGPRSRIRDARGAVPRRYRVLAWAWSVALFLPGFVMLDGGDAGPLRSPLLRVLGLDPPGWYEGVQDVVLILCAVVAVAAPLVAVLLGPRESRPTATAGPPSDAGQNRR